MTTSIAWPVPFILGPHNLAIDAVTAFVVSVLLACMVNAEAQAFASTFLGDSRVGAKDRFNFNVFLHLNILGSICYLVGGFGWPRTMEIDRSKFAHPRLYTAITRLAGPVANLLLAGIAASVVSLMKSFEWDPMVFLMVVGVNVTTAVYNLIPIPPLALGSLVSELLPEDRAKAILVQVGPFLVLALALLSRITPQGIFSPYLDPLVKTVFAFFRGA
ncbi:MAG: site-2 protease family protein [Desulfobaccales bacterium]|jgi:Zn-dependent protease